MVKDEETEELESPEDDACVNCGGSMSEEDGIEYCPTCDMQVDFFGDDGDN